LGNDQGNQQDVVLEPRLIEFGSVRNLTGGSGTMMMDGTITMVQI